MLYFDALEAVLNHAISCRKRGNFGVWGIRKQFEMFCVFMFVVMVFWFEMYISDVCGKKSNSEKEFLKGAFKA